MTHFLRDILRQPRELQRTINYLNGAGRPALKKATALVRKARHVFLTGIGSSWHAALTAGPLFYRSAHPVYILDAAELLQFSPFPPDSAIIVISRSGRSVEIVRLIAKARERGTSIIGITRSEDGPLAQEAEISITVPVAPDHAISVNTYSALAAAAGALAVSVVGTFDESLSNSLLGAIAETERAIATWQAQIGATMWLAPGKSTYFLARGSSLGSCHEARLLWEEGVKSAATAMGTGSFRHGPQEIVTEGFRFGMWIDRERMREQDLAVARDLRRLGASVLLIGQHLPRDSADLVFQLPTVPADWQFLIDIIPAQLAAERLAGLAGVDCDTFRLCSFIVEDEYGLLHEEGANSKDAKQ
jgi:glutamine---fructose-6-phosphate transaminase (isomerizing)